jgi:hypothetical protein
MQIDFHHAVIYVLSRLAGFSPDESEIVSYSSQYVDDATIHGVIRFNNNAMYTRVSSAHKMIDLHNTVGAENYRVWVPFHFLPGNGGLKAGEDPEGGFIKKLVCYPDSYVAEEMLSYCIADQGKPYGLHRLGITMHVLADTFSHQGFAGVIHKINDVVRLDSDIRIESPRFFKDLLERLKTLFIDRALPLGHGAALACPDLPYLKWAYSNEFHPELIGRDNVVIYNDAVKSIFESLIKFRKKDPGCVINEQISPEDLKQIRSNIENFTNPSGTVRHQQWIDSIARGEFSFGPENISYIPKGEGSWKQQALFVETSSKSYKYEYSVSFLSSNWKMFHDALQKHLFEVIHDILPKYGICVS